MRYFVHLEIIQHSWCSTRINSIYGLFVLLSTVGLDFLLLLLSYVLILRALLSTAAREEGLKLLSIAHICTLLLFFSPIISLSTMDQFSKHTPPRVYVLANLHFLVLPVLNPIVYSVKTKQTRMRISKMLTRGTAHAPRRQTGPIIS